MAERTNGTDNIIFLEARPQDVDSLTTFVPRSFFQVNEFMKGLFPDTPAMRGWWGGIFEEYIRTPAFHLPIAVDTSTNVVVGAVVFRGVGPEEPGGGFLKSHPPTEDHAKDWPEVIKSFTEDEERFVGGRGRFLIEVMGIDHAYQGRGIGKQLVANICEIADSKGYPIFLETSAAAGFYLKLGQGFKIMTDPNEKGGTLVREPAGKEN